MHLLSVFSYKKEPYMSRIPPNDNVPLPLEDAPGGATMSMLFRVMAHRPQLMEHALQLVETAMRTGAVDPRLKELLAIRVSQVNACFY
jgi:alkylhydroperoxidase family enzyme